MARLRGAAHEQRWPEDADGLWGEPPRVDPPRRADGPAERGLCQEIDRVGGEGLDHGRAVVECRGLVVWRSINLWGKKIFFFFSASSSSSPVPPLLPALHRIFSEDDFAGSRAHAFHFHRSAGTEKDLVLGGTALGRRSDPARICRFCTKTFLQSTCFSLSFSSHGLEISDDKMKNALFRGRKFTILGPCGILNWLTRQFISSSERRKKKTQRLRLRPITCASPDRRPPPP